MTLIVRTETVSQPHSGLLCLVSFVKRVTLPNICICRTGIKGSSLISVFLPFLEQRFNVEWEINQLPTPS